jgi:hypothetical protein
MNAMQALQSADRLTGVSRNLSRLTHIMGADQPVVAPAPATGGSWLSKYTAGTVGPDLPDNTGTLVGGVAGLYLGTGRKHPYLGLIAGASVGRHLGPLYRGGADRKLALRNLTTTAGGVAGSLFMAKRPVIGFGLGLLAGGLVAKYVAGWE